MIWLYFGIIQFIQLIATFLGWLLLVPFCLLQAWKLNAISIKDGRPIDTWKFSMLNIIYGNPEDGVSGKQAIIYVNGAPAPYLPLGGDRWRAYRWSAIRNSCDNLKYIFAKQNGPLKTVAKWGWQLKIGWQPENGFNVPVLSVKKVTT